MDVKELNINKIKNLCKRYKVSKLYVFGSILTDKFHNDSDVDMVVEFNKSSIEDYFDNYFNLKYKLEEYFKRKVDLLENQAIKNPYLRSEIDTSKQQIYGQ